MGDRLVKTREDLKVGDIVIFKDTTCDYRSTFDGYITTLSASSVSISYLKGYKSENTTIPLSDVLAYPSIEEGVHCTVGNYSGKFIVFGE